LQRTRSKIRNSQFQPAVTARQRIREWYISICPTAAVPSLYRPCGISSRAECVGASTIQNCWDRNSLRPSVRRVQSVKASADGSNLITYAKPSARKSPRYGQPCQMLRAAIRKVPLLASWDGPPHGAPIASNIKLEAMRFRDTGSDTELRALGPMHGCGMIHCGVSCGGIRKKALSILEHEVQAHQLLPCPFHSDMPRLFIQRLLRQPPRIPRHAASRASPCLLPMRGVSLTI